MWNTIVVSVIVCHPEINDGRGLTLAQWVHKWIWCLS